MADDWHLDVDRQVCVGSGMCVALAPDRFVLDGGKARPASGGRAPADDVLLDVADSCPAVAITVTDGASGDVVGPRP